MNEKQEGACNCPPTDILSCIDIRGFAASKKTKNVDLSSIPALLLLVPGLDGRCLRCLVSRGQEVAEGQQPVGVRLSPDPLPAATRAPAPPGLAPRLPDSPPDPTDPRPQLPPRAVRPAAQLPPPLLR